MIIESLCNAIYNVISALFSGFNIPTLEPEFLDSVTSIVNLALTNAQSIISLFIPWRIVEIGVPVVVFIMGIRISYPMVMWIVRKIPMLGIS